MFGRAPRINESTQEWEINMPEQENWRDDPAYAPLVEYERFFSPWERENHTHHTLLSKCTYMMFRNNFATICVLCNSPNLRKTHLQILRDSHTSAFSMDEKCFTGPASLLEYLMERFFNCVEYPDYLCIYGWEDWPRKDVMDFFRQVRGEAHLYSLVCNIPVLWWMNRELYECFAAQPGRYLLTFSQFNATLFFSESDADLQANQTSINARAQRSLTDGKAREDIATYIFLVKSASTPEEKMSAIERFLDTPPSTLLPWEQHEALIIQCLGYAEQLLSPTNLIYGQVLKAADATCRYHAKINDQEKLRERAIATLRSKLAPDHMELANWLPKEEAIPVLEKNLGPDHPSVRKAQRSLRAR